ncbi:hypothetical protein [Myxacorys almedinensis]|uniref:Uncharacterized protein n=1 Tax=Myxacorys almedinensis A TaxID=2690445 RepID=A0A8J7Z1M4_9CYAN|nr:hypothetical protein [Myxacorys almedinensis]NDJ18687.1 hypothetical protein [Myxacorys almedinensis A]
MSVSPWVWRSSIMVWLVFASGCSTLPTASSPPPALRPVEPLPFEKNGYTIATPSLGSTPRAGTSTPARTAVTLKPGKKLSESDTAALLEQADDKAVSAANLAQSAQSKDDWLLVMSQWRKAIALLQPIAAPTPALRQRLSTYQRNLAEAQTRSVTNPRQLVTEGSSGGYGVPLVVQPGKTSASESPSPNASPTTPMAPASEASPASVPIAPPEAP